MKVFKVCPGEGLNLCDVIKIEVLKMTEAEYGALPEYEGP